MLPVPASASEATALSEKGTVIYNECQKAFSHRNYEGAETKARELLHLGKTNDNDTERLLGESFLLRAAISQRDTTDFSASIERLDSRLNSLKEEQNWLGVSSISKTLAIYNLYICSDFSQASHYAFMSLDAHRKLNDKVGETEAISLLASIYFSKNDPAGWDYALESYNKAKALGNEPAIYTAASNMANYLFNRQKYEDALKYQKEAANIATRLHLANEETYINSFFGDIYSALKQDKMAEKYYKISLQSNGNKYDTIYAHVCYALFLYQRARYNEALALLAEAEKLSHKYQIIIFFPQIYAIMSGSHEKMGDYPEALKYQKLLLEVHSRISTREKEREFAILELRYRISEERNKNAAQSLELMKRSRTNIVIGAVAILLLLVIVGGFYYHRRRMADYKDIVRRHLDNADTERKLRRQLENALAQRDETSTRPSGMSDDKQNELFYRLSQLMEKEKIYRYHDLSLEKAASLLQTNRSYLSQVVNEKAGTSFSVFVNSFRLKEAIEILSDPANEESLKSIGLSVGFSTPSNFYTLFRQKVGVSPSVFRENVRNIKKESGENPQHIDE